jgi:hypothetical protein
MKGFIEKNRRETAAPSPQPTEVGNSDEPRFAPSEDRAFADIQKRFQNFYWR